MSELTKEEKSWVKKVNALLAKCPSPDRIAFYTIGDSAIGLYDLTRQDEIDDTNDDLVCVLQENGWGFDEKICFPSPVNGVCG